MEPVLATAVPTVILPKLPQHVCDILFASEENTADNDGKVSGIFHFEGKDIRINNSFKRKRCDSFTSPPYLQVFPNTSSDDSGFGTEDGSEYSKEDLGIKKRVPRWKGADEHGEYEVQKVVDHRFDKDGADQFFVKWLGWGSQSNTWEPLKNLNCHEKLNDFMKKFILDILFVKWRPLPSCKTLLATTYRSIIEQWVRNTPKALYLKKLSGGFNQKGLAVSTLSKMLNDAVHTKCLKSREEMVDCIKNHCALLRMKEVRKEQLELMKLWEDNLNSVGPGGLSVENQVDLEGPPKDFMYITQNITGPGVNSCMLIGQVAGCECTEECGTHETCCPNMAGVDWAYSALSRLIVSPRSGIFECNRFCSCGPDCPNRVVQRGRKVKLTIFRTANGRGWGLKAGERIERGAFLTTYLGEIITSEEAAARDVNYEKTGLSYLFDLDMMDPEEAPIFTIDAMKCGNESHFINHSCNPNAHVAGVWIETNDPAIPLLALFAKRSIKKGEEITFNYQGDQDPRFRGIDNMNNDPSDPNKPKRKKAKRCKCGSRFCKGFYF
ncbi:histone-lysine N-methyltransferase SUV39H1-A-like [Thrips palmi]|uniref:Histone-lysine N-methyltransferase n=1 Tax=Thrips palmi TaxID=161013 RepID=A0A6P8Y6B3_THRPL|nr:histone-lysine N-methyltransferase SUV39H1-A-like [Thrips palmi]XP_034231536.1 histone-lysine N-methyltransferase SUV39H1-A-like [Thrips palmi]XP_034231537.1 histone-lysine N-methyltransferase SUV39H1-A-like [Thrips palmi]XP_034231538.1 histone-lysine N-methyltransferase SUV39H1-A-like [Thrips palmi]XP_034231539.1 histone-lysine N-methyltransferase SUV39H1-A-like [Thrips palmi]XP_034231540.1 histone-lysine N-methyltransferase SUV39H1-A-like [Thrips palmi]